jgi:succinate-semialdehyde dehydrogenase / glutarate-semialdehyde dehydrogenase
MPIQTLNPFTEKVEKTFEEYSPTEVIQIINDVEREFQNWRETNFAVRSRFLKNAAGILRKRKNDYGEIITREMGKPFIQAVTEVEKCAYVCDYYADNAKNILAEEKIITDTSQSFVRFDPLGIIFAVMPWNFPFWQVFRFAAPALMAGNAVVLKHASNVPMCALAIEEIFKSAGFPENVFRTLLIGSSSVEKIILNARIKAITLTGSEPAGKKIAETCAKVLKKTVLELGGSDPFVVFDDADIDAAVNTAVTARLINNGQSCIAAKRFIIVEKIYEEFEKKFVERMKQIKIGDPMNPGTELGPMAREDLLIELDEQVKQSVAKGAKILCGGKRIESEGFFYEPTILSNVIKGMPAYEEELFGPVASLIRVKDEVDALQTANDSCYGLGASLWTNNIEKAKKYAEKIESGSVFVNGIVKSDPRLPFGGIKNSGYGRELSHYGIKEFVNIKTVWIK